MAVKPDYPAWWLREDITDFKFSKVLDDLYLDEKFTKQLSEPTEHQKFQFEIWNPVGCSGWHAANTEGELRVSQEGLQFSNLIIGADVSDLFDFHSERESEVGNRVAHFTPSELSVSRDTVLISVSSIRYVVMNPPYTCASQVSRNNIVLLSWRTAENSVRFLFMDLKKSQTALTLVNMIQGLKYKLDYPAFVESRKYFRPLVIANVPMKMAPSKDEPLKPNLKASYCLVDPEVIVALSHTMSPKPLFEAFWYTTDKVPGSVENVKLDHSSNIIEVQTSTARIALKLPDTEKVDKLLAAGVLNSLKRICPAEQAVFTDSFAREKHFADKGQQYFPAGKLAAEQQELEAAAKEDAATRAAGGGATSRLETGWDYKWQSPSTAEKEQIDINRAEMASMASMYSNMGKEAEASEEMKLMWVVAEAEIKELIANGYVPGSSISSGGLDPDSMNHLQKCIDEITESLFSQRYEMALSHVRGCKDVFQKSRLSFAKRLFGKARPDDDILRELYFMAIGVSERAECFLKAQNAKVPTK